MTKVVEQNMNNILLMKRLSSAIWGECGCVASSRSIASPAGGRVANDAPTLKM
jgi:hypothetical protein